MPNPDETRRLLAALEAGQRGQGIPLQQLLNTPTNRPMQGQGLPSWDVVPPAPPPMQTQDQRMQPVLANIARLLTSAGQGGFARASTPQPPAPAPALSRPPSDMDLLMQLLSGQQAPPVQRIGQPSLPPQMMQMPPTQMTTPVPRNKPRAPWEF